MKVLSLVTWYTLICSTVAVYSMEQEGKASVDREEEFIEYLHNSSSTKAIEKPESTLLDHCLDLMLFNLDENDLTKLTQLNLKSSNISNLEEDIALKRYLKEVFKKPKLVKRLRNHTKLKNALALKRLILSNNNLSDLPVSISQLTSLEELDISNNKFTHLPTILGSLTNLRRLIVSGRTITEIPEEIKRLPHLENLKDIESMIDHNISFNKK